jgi:SPP1 family predicted phage head-tail adaptor
MPGTKDTANGADFNRRIQIQAPSSSDDGQGGSSPTSWNTVYTCWANIENFPHGRGLFRKFLFQQLYPQMTTTIQIRFQKSVAIDPTMRVLYQAHGVNHIYQILGIENPMEANVSMWLLCMENQAKAVN